VIFTDNAEKQYQDFEEKDLVKTDENLGIRYEKDVILEDTILLLRYNCPDNDCDVACLGWPDLHRHVKTKHGKVMCDLCTRNKKVFTHEHELFTFGGRAKHEMFGDDNPGAIDQTGFKGHPECAFCKKRFYGDDELYNHCRENHERCHICDRSNTGRQPQYYRNYQELEKHFAEAHFVCLDAECQANKTNVFESEMDLKAHQLSEHPNGLSKDARRDARLVNLSGFDLRTPYQPPRRGGGGRGRDPNTEPLPLSSAQPLSRAELAYQRQMAIQSAQPVTTRPFGGQLTQNVPSPRPQPAQPAQQPAAASASEPPSLDTLSISAPHNTASMAPTDRARTLRHQAVTERAANLLGHSAQNLAQFRTNVSSYRSSKISAADLVKAFFSIFDCTSSELGILIRELADLYEDEDKRKNLLEAWNNWRSINEDYPSLPLAGGTASGAGADMGVNVGSGRRVLRLKSSTAQSSRSTTARQGSWGNVFSPAAQQGSRASGATREAFPSLTSSRKPTTTTFSWASSSQAPSSTASTNNTSRPASSVNPRKPPTDTVEAFPSLPAAARPNVSIAGFNTRPTGIRSSGTNTPRQVNAWQNGGVAPTPAQAASAVSATAANMGDADTDGQVDATAAGGKKKGKKGKNKGETLFHFG
jgi:E3 ubiquitin-protein ligase ZNF598